MHTMKKKMEAIRSQKLDMSWTGQGWNETDKKFEREHFPAKPSPGLRPRECLARVVAPSPHNQQQTTSTSEHTVYTPAFLSQLSC